MYTVLLVIHTIVVLFLIGVILIQRPDSDGLGGLGGGGSNILSGRAAGNMMTRVTAILATVFIVSSLVLAVMSGHQGGGSITDAISGATEEVTGTNPPATNAPDAAKPAQDTAPSVPKPE